MLNRASRWGGGLGTTLALGPLLSQVPRSGFSSGIGCSQGFVWPQCLVFRK